MIMNSLLRNNKVEISHFEIFPASSFQIFCFRMANVVNPTAVKATQTQNLGGAPVTISITPHKISLWILISEVVKPDSEATNSDKSTLLLFLIDELKVLKVF